ncbi:hypothetical protein [Luteolibacter sp.]
MYFENNRSLDVAPGWTAEIIFRYQVSMSGNGWGLVLHGPNALTVDKFKEFIWLCEKEPEEWTNEEFGKLLKSSLFGRFLHITTHFDGRWRVELATGMLSKRW